MGAEGNAQEVAAVKGQVEVGKEETGQDLVQRETVFAHPAAKKCPMNAVSRADLLTVQNVEHPC